MANLAYVAAVQGAVQLKASPSVPLFLAPPLLVHEHSNTDFHTQTLYGQKPSWKHFKGDNTGTLPQHRIGLPLRIHKFSCTLKIYSSIFRAVSTKYLCSGLNNKLQKLFLDLSLSLLFFFLTVASKEGISTMSLKEQILHKNKPLYIYRYAQIQIFQSLSTAFCKPKTCIRHFKQC